MCEIDSQTKKEKLQLHYILSGMDFEELREFWRTFMANYFSQTTIKRVEKVSTSFPEHKIHEPMDVVDMDELFTFVNKL